MTKFEQLAEEMKVLKSERDFLDQEIEKRKSKVMEILLENNVRSMRCGRNEEHRFRANIQQRSSFKCKEGIIDFIADETAFIKFLLESHTFTKEAVVALKSSGIPDSCFEEKRSAPYLSVNYGRGAKRSGICAAQKKYHDLIESMTRTIVKYPTAVFPEKREVSV